MFIALARRAGRVAWQTSIAGWLYKVAFRISLRARADAARRRETELTADPMTLDEDLRHIADLESEQALHSALHQLPAVYRDSLVLCCLVGRTREEAAQQVGCTPTVVKGRLQRVRQMLLMQLSAKGVVLATTLAAAQQSLAASQVHFPPALADAAVRSAVQAVSPQLSADVTNSRPWQLSQNLRTTMLHRLAFQALLAFVPATAAGLSWLLLATPPSDRRRLIRSRHT